MDGLFQVEGALYVSLFGRLPPHRFSDIVASIALNRPGLLESGMVCTTTSRSASGKTAVHYYDERLQPGFGRNVRHHGLPRADHAGVHGHGRLLRRSRPDELRKAMGKKKLDVMMKLKDDWCNGAVENGYSLEIAEPNLV